MTNTKAQKNMIVYGYAERASASIKTLLDGFNPEMHRRLLSALSAHLRADPGDAMAVSKLAEHANSLLPPDADDATRAECIKTLAKVL